MVNSQRLAADILDSDVNPDSKLLCNSYDPVKYVSTTNLAGTNINDWLKGKSSPETFFSYIFISYFTKKELFCFYIPLNQSKGKRDLPSKVHLFQGEDVHNLTIEERDEFMDDMDWSCPTPGMLETNKLCWAWVGNSEKYTPLEDFGGFLKWWYLQIFHLNRIFHHKNYKPSIFGSPHLWKHPFNMYVR